MQNEAYDEIHETITVKRITYFEALQSFWVK